jgi:hypothetical protein
MDIPDLNPDHHRVPRGASRVPGDLEQSRAEEEHHPRMVWRAELPVDGQIVHSSRGRGEFAYSGSGRVLSYL